MMLLCFQPNTFQFVLIVDPVRYSTHVMYLYKTTGWTSTAHSNFVGYYIVKDYDETTKLIAQSGKKEAFTLDNIAGDTGERVQTRYTSCFISMVSKTMSL